MSSKILSVAIAMLLAIPTVGSAQDNDDSDPSAEQSADGNSTAGLSMGIADPETKIGATYVAEEHGDWDVRCVKTETGKDPCQLYQLLRDDQGGEVAEFSMFNLSDGGQAVAGATIITPLETLLTEPLRLAVDGGEARLYPYRFCTRVGCFSRLGFTAPEVDLFRNGLNGTITIVAAVAPDKPLKLALSLKGFTAGWNDVVTRNAAAEE